MLNTTVEPLNKGHFGANTFVPCREVVPISEGPLSEVPLYTKILQQEETSVVSYCTDLSHTVEPIDVVINTDF